MESQMQVKKKVLVGISEGNPEDISQGIFKDTLGIIFEEIRFYGIFVNFCRNFIYNLSHKESFTKNLYCNSWRNLEKSKEVSGVIFFMEGNPDRIFWTKYWRKFKKKSAVELL